RWESKVHTWEQPASSACRASSTTLAAGGLVWRTTPTFTSRHPSAGPREPEVDRARGRVGPPGGHDLAPCVEVHAFGPVHVGVAEQRALPAAEGVVGDGHRDRHVHAYHPAVG